MFYCELLNLGVANVIGNSILRPQYNGLDANKTIYRPSFLLHLLLYLIKG